MENFQEKATFSKLLSYFLEKLKLFKLFFFSVEGLQGPAAVVARRRGRRRARRPAPAAPPPKKKKFKKF